MCGILGFVSYRKDVKENLHLYREGLKELIHRGPDASGEYYNDAVYLGHRRLSIIDLSAASNQPFKSVQSNAYIVFNGEIYNYQELGSSLPGLSTKSDTEVLLEGYLHYGVEFFMKLKGIYAFAIYDYRDLDRTKVLLYRDLSGIKPLYYFESKWSFAFSSEIKGLKVPLKENLSTNESILKTYINLGYCIEPQTIYNEISAVKPGELIVVEVATGRCSKTVINCHRINQVNNFSFGYNVEQTSMLLQQAVKRNLVADVDLAIALSGGIDSSLIYALANSRDRKYKGLSVKFNDSGYDETEISRIYADHLDAPIEIVETDSTGNLELLNRILLHFDQPYADSSAIPFYLLAKKASSYTKVLVGGDGGDEIQNGYPSMQWIPIINFFANQRFFKTSANLGMGVLGVIMPHSKRRQMKRILNLLSHQDEEGILCEWQSWFSPSLKFGGNSPFHYEPQEVFDVYRQSFDEIGTANTYQTIIKSYFYKRMMSDYLRKADMMSMINGIEYRVPMLDEDLVNFSFSVPFNQKSSWQEGKKIFRSIHRNTYPKYTSRIPKSGFSIPLDKWLSKEDFKFMREFLTDHNSIVTNYVSKKYIDFLFLSLNNKKNEKYISRASTYQRILILYSLQLWYCRQ